MTEPPTVTEQNVAPAAPTGERTYKTSNALVVVGCLVGGCLVVGGPVLVGAILTDEVSRGVGAVVFLVLVAMGLMMLGLWMVLGSLRYRLVLAEDRVSYRGALAERTLRLTEIAGYRFIKGGVQFQPVDPKARRHFIWLPAKVDDFLDAWFAQLVNLDDMERQEERRHLLDDPALGPTRAAREKRLVAVHSLNRWVDGAALLLGLGWLLSRHPYLVIVLLVWPWCLALLLLWMRPAVGVDVGGGSARADMAASVLLPPLALAVHALGGPRLWRWTDAVEPAILVGAFLAVAWVVCLGQRRRRERLTVIVSALTYGVAAVPVANRVLDRDEPEERLVRVQSKRVSEGRSRTYYVVVDGANIEDFDGELRVAGSLYDSLTEGAPACLRVHPGALKLPWLSVRAACDGGRALR